MKKSTLKERLYIIIFGTHTRAGRWFDIGLIITIVSSLVVLVLESVPTIKGEWRSLLRVMEYIFTAMFTIEYIARLYCSPRPFAYARSFFGIIDLMAILPTYLSFFFPPASYMSVIRTLRILRIFRVLKLVRFLQDSNILLRSLYQSRRKVFIFFSTVSVLVVIFGSLIYIIEGPDNGFTSIPQSIYWAIVTITTVGYGDLVPHTVLGKAVAAITMLLGYSIIAVPTGIITAELSEELQAHRQLVKCPNCSKAGHEADAEYCKHCGSQLPEPSQRVVATQISNRPKK